MTQYPEYPPSSQPPRYATHRGVLILVFGILGLVACAPLGIVAWIMGNTDLKEIRAGRMDPEGEGLTQAGRIIGMIATILLLGGLLMTCLGFLVFFLFAGGAAALGG